MPRFRTFLTCALLAVAGPAAAQTIVPINVFNAYLHVDPADATGPAVPILLSSLGLHPGYTIRLEAVGDWDAGPGDDVQTNTLGIFSGSATLLGTALLHRVPDAIDAGIDSDTGNTWPSGQPCDIPEDFLFNSGVNGVTIVIPPGAAYLFVSAADIYYRDNSDPDGDYGVKITLVEATDVPAGGNTLRAPAGAYPNPFVGGATIRFQSAGGVAARVTIYDSAGRRVRGLAGGVLPAGEQRVWWDGRDERGARATPGRYYARISGEGRGEVVRLNLVR